jgi:XTP/dITP diphosphohydrolase
MPRLLLATNNAGKVAEFRRLLQGCGWEIVTPIDLGLELSAEETGGTYESNARIKALAGVTVSGLVTIADDSGLEIEQMGGEPGVHSARFLGEGATYRERFAEIQRRLSGAPRDRRLARFVCVIAVADPRSGLVRSAEGEVRGDAGCGVPWMYAVCERLQLDYTFGIAANATLKKASDALLQEEEKASRHL